MSVYELVRRIDRNADGELCSDELRAGLHSELGEELSDDDIGILLRTLGGGPVQCSTFAALIAAQRGEAVLAEMIDEVIEALQHKGWSILQFISDLDTSTREHSMHFDQFELALASRLGVHASHEQHCGLMALLGCRMDDAVDMPRLARLLGRHCARQSKGDLRMLDLAAGCAGGMTYQLIIKSGNEKQALDDSVAMCLWGEVGTTGWILLPSLRVLADISRHLHSSQRRRARAVHLSSERGDGAATDVVAVWLRLPGLGTLQRLAVSGGWAPESISVQLVGLGNSWVFNFANGSDRSQDAYAVVHARGKRMKVAAGSTLADLRASVDPRVYLRELMPEVKFSFFCTDRRRHAWRSTSVQAEYETARTAVAFAAGTDLALL